MTELVRSVRGAHRARKVEEAGNLSHAEPVEEVLSVLAQVDNDQGLGRGVQSRHQVIPRPGGLGEARKLEGDPSKNGERPAEFGDDFVTFGPINGKTAGKVG